MVGDMMVWKMMRDPKEREEWYKANRHLMMADVVNPHNLSELYGKGTRIKRWLSKGSGGFAQSHILAFPPLKKGERISKNEKRAYKKIKKDKQEYYQWRYEIHQHQQRIGASRIDKKFAKLEKKKKKAQEEEEAQKAKEEETEKKKIALRALEEEEQALKAKEEETERKLMMMLNQAKATKKRPSICSRIS